MKRFIATTLTILLATLSAYTQDHLSLLDIPIDGTMQNIVNELELRGITYERNLQDNIAMLHGDKNGQQIDFLVVASEDTKHVYRITMLTQPKSKWRFLKKEYNTYKKALTAQYGEPNAFEMMMAPYNTKKMQRRNKPLQALIEERAQWAAFYTINSVMGDEIGSVMLQIAPENTLARVIIVYEDKSNFERYAPGNE